MLIASRQNPRIKNLVALRKRRERVAAGVTLVDGYEEVKNARQSNVQIQSLYYCPELMTSPEQTAMLHELEFTVQDSYELTRDVFEKVASSQSPDGWLAVVPAVGGDLQDIKIGKNPLILVCEAVEKPGNLGAMLRTADAAGFDAVIAVNGATDWGNPNIIRSSRGAIFSTRVADVTTSELHEWLKKNDIAILAATPSATDNYTDVDMKRGVAIFVGAEHEGLSDYWLDNADIKVRIPMAGHLDSLNVSTSAAILMYEAVRQRSIVS